MRNLWRLNERKRFVQKKKKKKLQQLLLESLNGGKKYDDEFKLISLDGENTVSNNLSLFLKTWHIHSCLLLKKKKKKQSKAIFFHCHSAANTNDKDTWLIQRKKKTSYRQPTNTQRRLITVSYVLTFNRSPFSFAQPCQPFFQATFSTLFYNRSTSAWVSQVPYLLPRASSTEPSQRLLGPEQA